MSKIYNDKYDITNLPKNDIIILKQIIDEFNQCNDIYKKSSLLDSIVKISGFNYIKKCIYCNLYAIYSFTTIKLTKKHIYVSRPNHTKHTINNITYDLCVCENCVKQKFKNNLPKRANSFFILSCKYSEYVYNIPHNIASDLRKSMTGITKNNMIAKYGEIEGLKKWESYIKRQSYTNTYEYKHKKYNWTREQFDEFNKSRAVTLNNLIKNMVIKLV